ncbi:MAG TPA: hypothetical protein DCF89_09490 [Flavobacteriales bacterium]|nr:hypothetical protein [Crocinitomicaceae bacterium]HAE31337.1 hypothetical protein [Flavobacteriales bacterium]
MIVLFAGFGLGILVLLLLGYEKVKVRIPTKVVQIVEADQDVEEMAINTKDDQYIVADKKLDKKIDRLEDSLISLKNRIDSLNASEEVSIAVKQDSNDFGFDSLLISGEDILVERDLLLSSELIKIEHAMDEEKIDTTDVLMDSLKYKLNIEESKPSEYLKVELWKSPLNYRGYKMSKSTLIVYGLLNELILHAYSQGDTILIETNRTSYLFEPTSNFKELCVVAE